jgi:hypothetical protein
MQGEQPGWAVSTLVCFDCVPWPQRRSQLSTTLRFDDLALQLSIKSWEEEVSHQEGPRGYVMPILTPACPV